MESQPSFSFAIGARKRRAWCKVLSKKWGQNFVGPRRRSARILSASERGIRESQRSLRKCGLIIRVGADEERFPSTDCRGRFPPGEFIQGRFESEKDVHKRPPRSVIVIVTKRVKCQVFARGICFRMRNDCKELGGYSAGNRWATRKDEGWIACSSFIPKWKQASHYFEAVGETGRREERK